MALQLLFPALRPLRNKAVRRCLILFWISLPSSAQESLRSRYSELQAKHPAAEKPLSKCVAPRILENRKARRYRTTLRHRFSESKPEARFCGRYFVFSEPITGGGTLFLADCESGKVTDLSEEFPSKDPMTDVHSCLLIERAPSEADTVDSLLNSIEGPPRLYLFQNGSLQKIKDPILDFRENR